MRDNFMWLLDAMRNVHHSITETPAEWPDDLLAELDNLTANLKGLVQTERLVRALQEEGSMKLTQLEMTVTIQLTVSEEDLEAYELGVEATPEDVLARVNEYYGPDDLSSASQFVVETLSYQAPNSVSWRITNG